MYDMEDITKIADQFQCLSEVTVDCYNQSEELTAIKVYFTDAMHFPFAATWRDPDEPGPAEPITVLGVDEVHERQGVLLSVKRGPKRRRLLAEQVWAGEESSANAIVLQDYRHSVDELHGLTPGYGQRQGKSLGLFCCQMRSDRQQSEGTL